MAFQQGYGQQQPQAQGYGVNPNQMQHPQQQSSQPARPASDPNDPWGTSQGGSGLGEFIFTVMEVIPENNKQDPTKQQLTWKGQNHEQKACMKSWGVGKDWMFDWNQAPPRYMDPRNPKRQVNENSTMGVLLRCLQHGEPYDLRSALDMLKQRPGGPLSPAAWQGTRWHFCRVNIDFGQGPREVLFPIAYLGTINDPMPQVVWRTQNHSSGMMASAPAPAGQMQGGQMQGGQFQQPQGYAAQPPGSVAGGYPPNGQQHGGYPQNQQPAAANMMQQPNYPPQGQLPPQGQQPGYGQGYGQHGFGPQGQPQQQQYPPQGGGYPQGQGQFHG